jgi:cell division protein FtsB
MQRNDRAKGSVDDLRSKRLSILVVCLVGGLAIAGPSGLIAWRENAHLREQRHAQLTALVERRDMLRHRVALLDPNQADPDLVTELIRKNLNVVHPDEVIINLETAD